MYLHRPLNFAHQGASHEAPPNTLAAFLLAAELGADGIEFDVQMTRDGHVVVIHDFTVDATTDGHGRVRDKTLEELQTLDAGAWFDPNYAGERIPTLDQVLATVGRRLLLNVELKSWRLTDDGLPAAVAEGLARHDLIERAVVSSFNPLAIRRVKRIDPRIATGLIYGPTLPFFLRRPWLRRLVRADALHPYYKLVDKAYLRWAKGQGYRVNVWTPDDPGEMWQLKRAGVDMIITNRPDLLREVLRAGEPDSEQGRRLPARLRQG